MRVGVISDTHGLLRPEAIAALSGSDLIVHAGDIGRLDVLEQLRGLAPTHAVRGNIDIQPWAQKLPDTAVVRAGRQRLFVLHDISQLKVDPLCAGYDAVVFGHSHRPSAEGRDGVLFLNPGSAGPRRFGLPVTMVRLQVAGRTMRPTIITLA
jgi:putative phosphoesterase